MRATLSGQTESPTQHLAVGYLRRSTDRQEQSIPDQKKAVERYATEHEFQINHFYIDDAISGTSSIGRKAFQQMIADAQKAERRFSTVIVYDVKRLGRVDNDEAGYYRHVLRMHGVEIRYASENFTGGGTDDLLRPVKQWQAHQESKDLSKVTIRGLLSKAETGFWMGGVPPFGYDLRYQSTTEQFLFRLRYMPDGTKQMMEDGGKQIRVLDRGERIAVSRKDRCRLVPGTPERVALIKRIFRLYTEKRMGFKAIADELNRSGTATARGKAWADHYSGRWAMTTVRAILVNPVYVGDMVWNRHTDARFYKIAHGVAVERMDGYGRRLVPNDEVHWIVVRDAHPGLVTRRIWELARQLMRQKPASLSQQGINPRTGKVAGAPTPQGGWVGPRAKFMLSGLISCARCGSRYEGYTQRGKAIDKDGARTKKFSYACGGYIRNGRSVCQLGEIAQVQLEGAVIDALTKYYARFTGKQGKQQLKRVVEEQLGVEMRGHQDAEATLKKRLQKLERTIRNLLDNITSANRELVDLRIVEFNREKESIDQKLASLERRSMSAKEMEALIDETSLFCSTLPTTMAHGSLSERQSAIRRCIERITVDHAKQEGRIDLRTLPVVAGGPEASRTERLIANLK